MPPHSLSWYRRPWGGRSCPASHARGPPSLQDDWSTGEVATLEAVLTAGAKTLKSTAGERSKMAQLARVVSLIPRSFATSGTGFPDSVTVRTAPHETPP